jgi:hypothetical protein
MKKEPHEFLKKKIELVEEIRPQYVEAKITVSDRNRGSA